MDWNITEQVYRKQLNATATRAIKQVGFRILMILVRDLQLNYVKEIPRRSEIKAGLSKNSVIKFDGGIRDYMNVYGSWHYQWKFRLLYCC